MAETHNARSLGRLGCCRKRCSQGCDADVAQRWFALFSMAWLNLTQCLLWFTFSSVGIDDVQEYLPRMTDAAANRLLNWGPAMFWLNLLAIYFLSWPRSLQRSMKLAAVLILVGAILQSVPCWLPENVRKEEWIIPVFLDSGHIAMAAAGPFIMGTPALLSALWFPEGQRATATCIGVIANQMGTLVGFPLGPAVTGQAGFANYLRLMLVLGMAPAALVLSSFPVAPWKPASAVARRLSDAQLDSRRAQTSHSRHIGRIQNKSSFVIVAVVTGLNQGVMCAWQSTFQETLGNDSPAGMSSAAVGWLGLASRSGYCFAALLSARVVDHVFILTGKRHYKATLLTCFGICAIIFWVFALSLPTSTGPLSWARPVINVGPTALMVLASASDFVFGLSITSAYELAAELSYPALDETWSSNAVVVIFNLSAFVCLFVPPSALKSSANVIIATTFTLTFLLCLCVQERLFRTELTRDEASMCHAGDALCHE